MDKETKAAMPVLKAVANGGPYIKRWLLFSRKKRTSEERDKGEPNMRDFVFHSSYPTPEVRTQMLRHLQILEPDKEFETITFSVTRVKDKSKQKLTRI